MEICKPYTECFVWCWGWNPALARAAILLHPRPRISEEVPRGCCCRGRSRIFSGPLWETCP
jgi:hypothetical protein